MATDIPILPFDPSGTLPGNLISGEIQVLQPIDWKEEQFIVPKLSPYFSATLEVIFNGVSLVEGVDFIQTHHFLSASRAIGKPVYGTITFLKNLVGEIELSYQSLGGDYLINDPSLLLSILESSSNPRVTTWEFVSKLPEIFPVIDHEYHLTDLVGMSEVKDSLDVIRLTIENRPNPTLTLVGHMENTNNPHGVTKRQVGLGNVKDLPLATQLDSEAGLRNDRYMTPLRTKEAIDKQVNIGDYYSKTEVDTLLAQLKLDILNGV